LSQRAASSLPKASNTASLPLQKHSAPPLTRGDDKEAMG
jgi:hypothetical protein